MKRRAPWLGLLLVTLTLVQASGKGRIVEQALDESFKPKEFKNLIVVGITDDIAARKNFENKFVSHLRGRGLGGVTSHSLVPDLMEAQDEQAIVRAIKARGIDGAITVRVVPLDDTKAQAAWVADWSEPDAKDEDLRELIDASLPVAGVKAGRYGVEAALWETESWHRIWGGRIEPASRKTLRKQSGTFVESIMDALTHQLLL